MRIRTLVGAVLGGACCFVLSGTSPTGAAVVFSEDFEARTVGSFFGSPWTDSDSGAGTTTVRLDTGAFFGVNGNRYGEFIDSATSGDAARADVSFTGITNSFITVSFDFYEPVLGPTGNDPAPPALPFTFNVQVGTNAPSTGSRGIDFRLTNGEIMHTLSDSSVNHSNGTTGDYALGVKNHIDIVANFNAGTANYGFGTVASGHYDVWINGSLINTADIPFRVASQATGSIDTLRLGTDLTTIQNFFVDNVVVYNEAIVVPEPNAGVLLALGGLLLTRRRKS